MNLEYFKLAVSNLTHRKLRSWLTMIGIFIGIAAVVSLISMGEGLRTALNSQFGFLGTDLISVTASGGFGPPGTGVVNPLSDKELKAIEDVSGVEDAAGRLLEPVKFSFNRKTSFGYAASIPNGEKRKVIEKLTNMEAKTGRLLQDSDQKAVFLGANFAENTNRFDKAISPGAKILINDIEFKVIGIMEKKGSAQTDNSVFINEDDLREIADRQETDYDLIAVRIIENSNIEKIQLDIEKKLRKIRDVKEGEEDFSVQTPAAILESVNSVLLGVQIFVYIIAGISILVGGIGIMNTMYTAVVERTKEIGIMKSIGAKNSAIFKLFFIESGLLGTIGGLIGVTLGVLIAAAMVFLGRTFLGSGLISANFPLWLIIGSLLGSFLLGSFFGTLPAVQASKLNPVDALRYAK